jgi:hypothetical protein
MERQRRAVRIAPLTARRPTAVGQRPWQALVQPSSSRWKPGASQSRSDIPALNVGRDVGHAGLLETIFERRHLDDALAANIYSAQQCDVDHVVMLTRVGLVAVLPPQTSLRRDRLRPRGRSDLRRSQTPQSGLGWQREQSSRCSTGECFARATRGLRLELLVQPQNWKRRLS